MEFKVAVLSGDGIGPEVTTEGIKILQAIGKKFGHEFELDYGLIGGIAIDKLGIPLPEETKKICDESHAVLLGAVGGPKWDDPKAKVRPEQALLGIRKHLDLFANLRPVKVFPMLIDASTIKPEVLRGVDLLVIRELTGGIYFGEPSKQWTTPEGRRVVDTLAYTEQEIERVVRVGFEMARLRRKKLTSVDKANVLESSRLWRQIVLEIAPDYPDVTLEHILVDACAMYLIRTPTAFDVIVTENLFGDILTDEASMLAGSMGMLASASLGSRKDPSNSGRTFGLYEPIHGSAPTIAGQNIANPIATILSIAMMARHSFALPKEAEAIEKAVDTVLEKGYRTIDITEEGKQQVGTSQMGDLIAEAIATG